MKIFSKLISFFFTIFIISFALLSIPDYAFCQEINSHDTIYVLDMSKCNVNKLRLTKRGLFPNEDVYDNCFSDSRFSKKLKPYHDFYRNNNFDLQYRIPESKEELYDYDVVIASFCDLFDYVIDNNQDELFEMLSDYLSHGGSLIVLGNAFCRIDDMISFKFANEFLYYYGIQMVDDVYYDYKERVYAMEDTLYLTEGAEYIYAHWDIPIEVSDENVKIIYGTEKQPYAVLKDVENGGTLFVMGADSLDASIAFSQSKDEKQNFSEFLYNLLNYLADQTYAKWRDEIDED